MIKITSIQISTDEVEMVTSALKSGRLVQGQLVEALETGLAEYVGAKHAIAVNSGTAALHTALHAIGIQPGDEVITTPFSFVATANTILMCGGIPVFADIDASSFNIDPHSVERLITPRTKAVLAVDLYGNPIEYDSLLAICRKRGLKLIADSCQALGASFKGKKVGSLADVSVFSLYASKNIFSGEGGVITTNSEEYAQKCKLFRNHGQTPGKQYEYHGLGYNYRLTDVLAGIVLPQLKKIDQISEKRHANASRLSRKLADVPGLILPGATESAKHCFHQYTVRVLDTFPMSRDKLQAYLQDHGIETRVYYPQLLTDIPHVRDLSVISETPHAHQVISEVLSIPVHQHLSETELDTIAETIQSGTNHD